MKRLQVAIVLLAAVVLNACEREAREFRSATSAERAPDLTTQTSYRVGTPPAQPGQDPLAADREERIRHLEHNAPSLSEGQWLYVHFNCYGCHSHGGGGDMGPPLIDSHWRYGHRPDQVLTSILRGRPNGMPAFASKVTRKQAWELTAYVRSMSGLAAGDAASGRDDHMNAAPPPHTIENGLPRETGPPAIPVIRRPGDGARSAP